MQNISPELRQIRAQRKQETRNERADRLSLAYRDGYAAGRSDYVSFLPAAEVDGLIGLNDRHVSGYKHGYKDASRGRPQLFAGHPVPVNFGHSLTP